MSVTPLPRGSTPQYTLLAQELLRGIGAGDYPLGSLLPTEAELCKRYAVSRITARAAVRELQTRGLVSRHPGIGTRIESVQTRTEFVHVSESVDAILQSAQATRFKVLRQGEVVADAALAAELHCAEGQSFLVAEGLRTREGAPPQCHARLYFPMVYSRVTEHLDGHPGSVMLLLERLFGVRLEEMRQTISAANLRAAEARVLQAKPREAALQTRRWHLGENGRLHMMGVSLYPQDRYSYALRMRRQNNASTEER
ncbi:MAG: GntR family transcriptional regulator [Betaproteobacteria bacterium]|nr:GntR family transcriptional regulator [Betaproteobacteria bacterium]